MQQSDFEAMFEALEGRPMTVRYLDPPLHEFLPTDPEDITALALEMNLPEENLKDIIKELHEVNPMMGHRGCRLSVSYPEIAEMQTTAVIKAALEVQKCHPAWAVVPEIMIPLVGDIKELNFVKNTVDATAKKLIEASGTPLTYQIGTMVEVPRAALMAGELAKSAEFFSFGTNDLTQMTFGFSRDDSAKFLNDYYKRQIYEADPFARFDQDGVGQLIKIAHEKGNATRPGMKMGICGEHGGDPASIEFFQQAGLDYVSCSPFRVPIARLAGAQAALRHPRQEKEEQAQ